MLSTGDFAGALRALEAVAGDVGGDFALAMRIAALRRRVGDLPGALDAANKALAERPYDFVALLLKASLLEQQGDGSRAAEIYRAAVFHAPDTALPPPLRMQLDQARAFLARFRERVTAALALPSALPSELPAQRAGAADRFVANILDRRAAYHQEPTHYRYPGLPDVEFFDGSYPELCERLRDAFPDIRSELLAILNDPARPGRRGEPYVQFSEGEPMGVWTPLNGSPSWNALHLKRYGETIALNADDCPRTMEAFSGPEIASIANLGPNLMFSVLAPRTRIPPHHGVANFRCVVHLPLVVPPACGFRVGADTRSWIEGEPWIFDDTIEHEAWNDSDSYRIVLIGDVWRPELDETDKAIIAAVLGAIDAPASAGAL